MREEPDRSLEGVVEELVALLMAAQEPIAAALTWQVLCTGASAELTDRLEREGMGTPYASAVVEEILRLHPAAIGVLRRLTAPMRLDEHELAPATTLMVPIPLLHRDPRSFTEPERLLPERHLRNAAEDSLLAFGGGERSCLGAILARMEIATILPVIWQRMRLRPLVPTPERMVLRGTILVPQRSGLVISS